MSEAEPICAHGVFGDSEARNEQWTTQKPMGQARKVERPLALPRVASGEAIGATPRGAASGATSSGAAHGATPAASGASLSEAQCDKGWLDSDIYSMSKVELDIVQIKLGSSVEEAIVDSLWREVWKAAPQCLPGRDCDEEEIANDSNTSSGEDDTCTLGKVGLPPGSACRPLAARDHICILGEVGLALGSAACRPLAAWDDICTPGEVGLPPG